MRQQQMIKALLWMSLLPAVLLSQTNNFLFVQHDTAYVGSEELVVQYGEIINLVGEAQDLTVTRVTHQIPVTWSCSFCVGSACLPPFLDQYTFTLEAGDTSEFSLDTLPFGEVGIGSWTIFAENSASGEIDSVHITLEYVTVGVDEPAQAPSHFELSAIYPNPSNASINFDLQVDQQGIYSITLFSLDGRQIAQRSYALRQGANKLQWQLSTVPSGSYVIVAEHQGRVMSRKVSVIK